MEILGPEKIPAITYGIVKLNAEKIAKGKIDIPLTRIYFYQKHLVIIMTINKGIKVPHIA